MKKQERINAVIDLEDKYFDLVWYARSSPTNFHIQRVKENSDRIEALYPKETDDIKNDNGWHHGFNSGMLAGMRYVLTLYRNGQNGGKELADEEFPFLDT